MAKFTRKILRRMAEEILSLKGAAERYKELEAELRTGLQEVVVREVVTEQGRVFISTGEHVTVPPALLRDVVGEALASRIIQESVPNDLIKAFVTIGDITPEQRELLLAGADKVPVASLHVRPLK